MCMYISGIFVGRGGALAIGATKTYMYNVGYLLKIQNGRNLCEHIRNEYH